MTRGEAKRETEEGNANASALVPTQLSSDDDAHVEQRNGRSTSASAPMQMHLCHSLSPFPLSHISSSLFLLINNSHSWALVVSSSVTIENILGSQLWSKAHPEASWWGKEELPAPPIPAVTLLNNIVRRSIPKPNPPVGGKPCSRAAVQMFHLKPLPHHHLIVGPGVSVHKL
ncbi:hypothetical protein MUK42_14758 [Musa troglodytarum]|uniref:Uncharacterized protein n=1 Tax=Musa troglodytarum TaxID=320322 RepID=A0A9E7EZR2_9LILI|nr:hypothetical protein MUK42_14758 [Musa troglodytarum]